jgi:hypothetical protein
VVAVASGVTIGKGGIDSLHLRSHGPDLYYIKSHSSDGVTVIEHNGRVLTVICADSNDSLWLGYSFDLCGKTASQVGKTLSRSHLDANGTHDQIMPVNHGIGHTYLQLMAGKSVYSTNLSFPDQVDTYSDLLEITSDEPL